MKVYSLITERDGETTKAPGCSTTKLERTERLYAADSILAVWEYVHKAEVFSDYGETIISLSEVAPAIHIIDSLTWQETLAAEPSEDLACLKDLP
jgi:hypothetical protein